MYKTVLDIVNIVLRRLSVNTVAELAGSTLSEAVLNSLNYVVHDISDAGRMVERRVTREFTLDTRGKVLVSASACVNNIEDVYYGPRSLVVKKPSEIRNRMKQARTQVTPVEFAVVGASAGAVELSVWGIPTSTTVVDVSFYTECPVYGVDDDNTVVPYDYLTVAQGTYSDMLLGEAGEASTEYQVEYAKYKQRRDKAVAKYTSDTGSELKVMYTWR